MFTILNFCLSLRKQKTIFFCYSIHLFLFFFALNSSAQPPNWQWAKQQNTSGSSTAQSVITDPYGNIYVTGNFFDASITFGIYTLNNDTVDGTSDMFIIKYNSSGNVIWAKSAGGSDNDRVSSIAADSSGIYIVGYYSSKFIRFDTLILPTDSLPSYSSQDMFISKYDTSGNVLWAKTAGGFSNETANSVSADTSGIYVTGIFGPSSIIFDTTTLTPKTNPLICIGAKDIFVVKYNKNGNVIWAKNTGGSCSEFPNGISLDYTGLYVIGGYDNSDIDFSFASTTVVCHGDEDIFILKYDKNGNEIWIRTAGGTNYDYATCLTADSSGVYVGGIFASPTVAFATGNLANINNLQPSYDIFIVKYNPLGMEVWKKREGGYGTDEARSIFVDSSGVYLGGGFSSILITFGSTTIYYAGMEDMFLTKYNFNGNVIWAKGNGSSNIDVINSVAKYGKDIYVAGHFLSPTINFGPTILTNSIYSQSHMFLAKTDTTFSTIGIPEFESNIGIRIYPNPFSNETTLSFNEEQIDLTIKIIDLLGNEIKRYNSKK
ncbi:MAG: hypothetical protein A3F72_01250 [Bacteroidetes bacterium RIFCSPLOWO2_12_FULL_35_15]|nr:MAG: hypothetical protein A3F72_01250 [Bacteroidetes bacterium RIFCSPLOWO2_12_FULL_35_15]